jgi:hypothetical protein
MLKGLCGLAALTALQLAPARADADQQIQPGMALDPRDVPPEARQYEGLLQGDSSLSGGDDTVENRRHFDDRRFHIGTAAGVSVSLGSLGAFVEADVWDRLALGGGGGIGVWGPAVGTYARLRPFVWGGVGKNTLSAFTLELGYGYMSYGGDAFGGLDLMPCIEECKPSVHHRSVFSHFGSFSAGLEHALFFGLSIHYSVGYGRLLSAPSARCELENVPVDCGSYQPQKDFMVGSLALSYGL